MERLRIREAVESGRYEETLKVAFHAPRAEIHQAHIRALAKHRNCTVTRELINHAKSRLTCETDLAKGRRLILIGILEQPDIRRWETLPRWLQVARIPCPPDIREYDVVVKNAKGRTVRTFHVDGPITRRRAETNYADDLMGGAEPTVGGGPSVEPTRVV